MKKYILPTAIIVLLAAAAGVRYFSGNKFSGDPTEGINSTLNTDILISQEMAEAIKGKLLIVDLDSSGFSLPGKPAETLNLNLKTLLDKKNKETIFDHGCPVVLYSKEQRKSSEAWMILKQMGLELIFILSEADSNEVLKYRFRPDSVTGPESDK